MVQAINAYVQATPMRRCINTNISIHTSHKHENTFEAFRDLAAKAPTSTSPADGLPVGGLRKLKVDVGLDGKLTFTPNNITELPNTVVSFSFNPRNHSVTQSNFDNPCQPLEGGFSSGFIPTSVSPSGATFDIVIPDKKPIWFYCGQVNGNHCQSGMVGSINAPLTGNTLDAFIAKAADAPPPSTIPPTAPLGGTVIVNGTVDPEFVGNVLKIDAPPAATDTATGATNPPTEVPNVAPTEAGPPNPPSTATHPPAVPSNFAGGGKPTDYHYPENISEVSVAFLQILQFLDAILSDVLAKGYSSLAAGGNWAGVYPEGIVHLLGSMAAQVSVHRDTATEYLVHFSKPSHLGTTNCVYKKNPPETDTVDEFLQAVVNLLSLEVAVFADASSVVAAHDPLLVPVLVSEVGAKSRMAAVVDMMDGHIATAAPREILLPARLAWSYATSRFVESCGEPFPGMPEKPYPELEVTNLATNGEGRATSVTLKYESDADGDNWVAWIGPMGDLVYTQVNAGDKTSEVPSDLHGHAWIVVTSKKDVSRHELPDVTVAGPELVWIGGN